MCQTKVSCAKKCLSYALISAGEIGNIISISCNKLLNDEVISSDLSAIEEAYKVNEKIQKLISVAKDSLNEVSEQVLTELSQIKTNQDYKDIGHDSNNPETNSNNSDLELPDKNIACDSDINSKNQDLELTDQHTVIEHSNENSNSLDNKLKIIYDNDEFLKPDMCFVVLERFPVDFKTFMHKNNILRIYSYNGALLYKISKYKKKQHNKIHTRHIMSAKEVASQKFENFRKMKTAKRKKICFTDNNIDASGHNLISSSSESTDSSDENCFENNISNKSLRNIENKSTIKQATSSDLIKNNPEIIENQHSSHDISSESSFDEIEANTSQINSLKNLDNEETITILNHSNKFADCEPFDVDVESTLEDDSCIEKLATVNSGTRNEQIIVIDSADEDNENDRRDSSDDSDFNIIKLNSDVSDESSTSEDEWAEKLKLPMKSYL